MFKKISTVLAILMVASMLASCAAPATPTAAPAAPAATTAPAAPAATTAPAAGTGPLLVVINKSADQQYFIDLQNSFSDTATGLGATVKKFNAKLDPNLGVSLVNDAISAGAKGISITVPDQTIGPAISDAAKKAGVVLIATDDGIKDSSGNPVPFVGFDGKDMGKKVGQEAATLLSTGGWLKDTTKKVGVLSVEVQTLSVCNDRTDNEKAAIEAAGVPAAQVFSVPYTGETLSAQDAAGPIITAHPDVTNWIVFGCNDEGVLGTLNALATAGVTPDNIIGVGLGAYEACKPWAAGQPSGFKAALFISGLDVGKTAATVLYNAVTKGTPPPADSYAPTTIVDPNNYKTVFDPISLGNCSNAPAAPAATAAPTAAMMAPTTAAAAPALSSTSGANTLVCLVTDVGGINDKSFNATAWKGVTDAQAAYGLETPKYLQSKQQTDYANNIQNFMTSKCDLIVTVGFLLGDATAAAAKATPTQKFTIVDNAYDPPVANIRALTFSTDQAAFLAGYLAAGMTKTGKIGTFGGLQIPTVTIFEDGFVAGAQYYNKVHSTTVQVLGWDPIKKTGLFAGGFNDQTQGKNLANNLLQEGADIIMPVAGAVGLGAAAAIQAAGNGAMVIGVDTDWTVSASDYTSITLTSVMKNMDVAVKDTIASVIAGNFQGGNYVGTLANNGVQIAPFHDFDSKVPDALKAELTQLKADVISGKVSVTPAAQ